MIILTMMSMFIIIAAIVAFCLLIIGALGYVAGMIINVAVIVAIIYLMARIIDEF